MEGVTETGDVGARERERLSLLCEMRPLAVDACDEDICDSLEDDDDDDDDGDNDDGKDKDKDKDSGGR